MERQLEKLVPEEIKKIRDEASIVYIPIGSFEWHGPHLPAGNDTLKIHKLSLMTAEITGGGVLPPFYLGFIPEEEWDLKFQSGFHIYDREFYTEVLTRMFSSITTMGFKLYVPFVGHTPMEMIEAAEQASQHINKEKGATFFPISDMEIGLRTLGFTEPYLEICNNWQYENYQRGKEAQLYSGDHAAFGETSILLDLYPELVHLENLDPEECSSKTQRFEKLGLCGESPLEASEKAGRNMVEAIVKYAADLVTKKFQEV